MTRTTVDGWARCVRCDSAHRGGDRGLGHVVVASGGNADTPLAFAATALLGAVSMLLFHAVVLAERALLPWAREITG
ncbi:hypothetical protein [Streptomyces sp. NPDC088350]|uniref:hypothetical protein n=1 Tax=Streptomyces sp. NPDC088350 TaxID=3365854 RepID=UPI0037FC6D7F